MKKIMIAAIMSVVVMVSVGCNQSVPGTSRVLGEMDFNSAFNVSRNVMQEHFPIRSANLQTGTIKSKPKSVRAKKERLIGSSPAREVATLRLLREGKSMVAYLSIARQRQGSAAFSEMGFANERQNPSGVPTETPAQLGAASTAEQNETWRTDGYDRVLENKILMEIARRLDPASPASPAVSK